MSPDKVAVAGITPKGEKALEEFEKAQQKRSTGNREPANVGTLDKLTGLWNKETLDVELARSIDEALRTETPLGLIFADIDKFKHFNDTYGHEAGNEVLAGVAACVGAVAKGKGAAYRYGGEEIVVVLPNHSLHEATSVAERMRSKLEHQQIGGKTVTGSFGVSALPDHGRTPKEILEAADKAMYDAKDRGRNLVRMFGEPAPKKENQPREPDRKAPQPGKLTEQQKQQIRTQHFQGHAVTCPVDEAILNVRDTGDRGAPHRRLIQCPLCGLREEI